MGASNSCCSVEAPEDEEIVEGSMKAEAANANAGELRMEPVIKPVSDAEIEAFQKRLEQSMDVVVLLADGSQLACELKLNPAVMALVLTSGAHRRVLSLKELKALLHTIEQLKRIQTRASLVEDANRAVALHLIGGHCIPIRFDELKHKEAFVAVIKKFSANVDNDQLIEDQANGEH